MLYLIPIEPLTERYTESWYRNIPELFNDIPTTVIDGQPLVEDDIKVGAFLDINSTVHYKMTQLQKISALFNKGMIKNGDVFFFYDMEFWGLESIRLMADMNKVSIKICAFLHAASYTKGDAFEIASPYQQYTEIGWYKAVDRIFVGSEYHKNIFWERRVLPILGDEEFSNYCNKVIVTTNPIFEQDYCNTNISWGEKDNTVLLCNRLDKEKGVFDSLRTMETLKREFPDWTFRVCTSRKTLRSNDPSIIDYALQLQKRGIIDIRYGLSKKEYHEELRKAKFVISDSPEESFGICIAETLVYHGVPVLLYGASHPEFRPYGAITFEKGLGDHVLYDLLKQNRHFTTYYDTYKGKYKLREHIRALVKGY